MFCNKPFNSFMTEVPVYRNQSIDLQRKSMDWFLYDRDLHHERVKAFLEGKIFEDTATSLLACNKNLLF